VFVNFKNITHFLKYLILLSFFISKVYNSEYINSLIKFNNYYLKYKWEFNMKKIILVVIFIAFIFSSFSNTASADSIVLPNGTITGKITYILSDFIEIRTAEGVKKISRNDSKGIHKDIVIAGIFKKNKITGNVYFLDENAVEISTVSGTLKISRYKVKDIILYK